MWQAQWIYFLSEWKDRLFNAFVCYESKLWEKSNRKESKSIRKYALWSSIYIVQQSMSDSVPAYAFLSTFIFFPFICQLECENLAVKRAFHCTIVNISAIGSVQEEERERRLRQNSAHLHVFTNVCFEECCVMKFAKEKIASKINTSSSVCDWRSMGLFLVCERRGGRPTDYTRLLLRSRYEKNIHHAIYNTKRRARPLTHRTIFRFRTVYSSRIHYRQPMHKLRSIHLLGIQSH